MAVKIDYDKCCWKDGKCVSESCGCESNAACGDSKGCDGCVEACPVQALTRGEIVEINNDECISCSACVAACEKGAISLE